MPKHAGFPSWRPASPGWRATAGRKPSHTCLGELPESDQLPGFAADRRPATAHHFIELTVLPMQMRALFGEDLAALRAEIGPHVARAVGFFLAACRYGGAG